MKQTFEIEWGLGKFTEEFVYGVFCKHFSDDIYKGITLSVKELPKPLDKYITDELVKLAERAKEAKECVEGLEEKPKTVRFTECIASPSDIHPTAIIDEGAVIGHGTKVWHHAHISEGAVIDNNCIIGDNVYIGKNVVIKAYCKIQNNAYIPEGVSIGHSVFIGPSVTFTNVKYPKGFVKAIEFEKTVVHDGATIGANATILCGLYIGEESLIGAGSVVTRDVSAKAVICGNPAEQVYGMEK